MSDTSNSGVGQQDSGSTYQNSSLTSSLPKQSPNDSVVLNRTNPRSLNHKSETGELPYWAKNYDLPLWAHLNTEEPLSTELRARVREVLINKGYYLTDMDDYRKMLKREWRAGDGISIESPSVQLELSGLPALLNRLTSFYCMPSAATKFRNGSLGYSVVPLICIFEDWFRYHDNKPYTECQNFFANFQRIHPSGPTTVKGIIELHKHLLNQAASLRERIDRREGIGNYDNRPWVKNPENYHLRPTIRAIIIMMDQDHRLPEHLVRRPSKTGPFKTAPIRRRDVQFDEHEQSTKQRVLLVRTGDDSHLKSPITFEALKTNDLCLPLDRSDVPVDSDDVVRVSLANAIKFICDLERREDMPCPERPRALLERERKADEWADEQLKAADEKGIDNLKHTWFAVRRAKGAQIGGKILEYKHTTFVQFIIDPQVMEQNYVPS